VTQLSPQLPGGFSLRALLADGGADLRGQRVPDVRVASCTSDWRQVRPGDVFVAIVEAEDDGHDGATEAAQRGAAAIICERPLPVFNVPQIVVPDSRVTHGQLCQALVGNPSRELKVIGVTGTHGKTTVARLLSAIFSAAGRPAGTLDSYGYWDGEEDQPASEVLTAPILAKSLAQMSAAGVRHAVVEVSSRELMQQVLAGVTLDAVCLTNVGRSHLDWHGSLQNYRQAKRRIFDYLQPDGIVSLNADDPISVEFLSDLNFPALTYGLKLPSEITAQIIEQQINEQSFVLSAGDDSVAVRTEIVGDHHVYNCLAAATTALAYGIDLPTIARGLEAVDRLPGRMERVVCGQDFAVVVDAASSPDALRVCLRAARRTTTGRLTCVFGASDDCDTRDLPAIGRVIGAMADAAVITSGSTSIDGSHRSCLEIRSGFAETRKAHVILDRAEAITWALSQAKAGDTVVIAGMGERPHTPVGAAATPANDCELVQQMLYGKQPAARYRLVA
jgi:UDP-N-acetylmuramoyl-L-alanyl-D-glutamate--2,6-diaminopimelate ligase